MYAHKLSCSDDALPKASTGLIRPFSFTREWIRDMVVDNIAPRVVEIMIVETSIICLSPQDDTRKRIV